MKSGQDSASGTASEIQATKVENIIIFSESRAYQDFP